MTNIEKTVLFGMLVIALYTMQTVSNFWKIKYLTSIYPFRETVNFTERSIPLIWIIYSWRKDAKLDSLHRKYRRWRQHIEG